MDIARNRHSRFVATAKVVLPLAALVLFATLFLFARTIDPENALPYANVDVRSLARESRVGAPTFSALTEDGTAVSLTASAARPDPDVPGRMTVDRLTGVFEPPDGSRIDVAAAAGAVDNGTASAELSGGVELVTSTGYRLETAGIVARFDRTDLHSTGSVAASGPAGRIDAGGFRMTPTEGDPGTYVLVFTGGVKLVYDPQS